MLSIANPRRRRGTSPGEKSRQRNLLAVSLAAFLASVGFMVVMPLLPSLIRELVGGDVAASGLWLGFAVSVSPLLTALTGPFWGSLANRFGHKAMIERSLICIGIGIGLLAVASAPVHVVLLRAVIGGLGGVSVAALAAVTASTPKRDLGPAVGTLQAAQTAGSMVGPMIGGVLGIVVGMREAFLVSGAVFVAALGLVHWLYREGSTVELAGQARQPREAARRGQGALGAGMLVALATAFGIQFVEGGLLVMLPLELERLGLGADSLTWVLGLGFSGIYLAATVAALIAGRLAVGRSPVALLAWTLVFGLLPLVPLAFAASWWQFLGLRVLLALVAGAAPTLAYSAAAALAPPEQRGRMVAMVSSAGILGWALSPMTAGAVAQTAPLLVLRLDVVIYVVLALALFGAHHGAFKALPRTLANLHGLPALLPNVAVPRQIKERLPGSAALLPARRPQRFTAEEVVAALRSGAGGERAELILDLASRPWEWMPADRRGILTPLPRYADRLPTVLYLFRQGMDPEEIGRTVSPLGGRWPVERAINGAAELIAARLNRS